MNAKRASWTQLEAGLRRLVRLRELRAPAEAIAQEIELARDLWSRLPPPPFGMKVAWPEDVRAVARELGFDGTPPGASGAGAAAAMTDPAIAEGVRRASALYAVVAAVSRALEEAGLVEGLSVVAAGNAIELRGVAADGRAREEAGAMAARVAPGHAMENRIEVRGGGER